MLYETPQAKKTRGSCRFKGDAAQLLLLYDGTGIGQGGLVQNTGKSIMIPVGEFSARTIDKSAWRAY